jgi:hypothetical protein
LSERPQDPFSQIGKGRLKFKQRVNPIPSLEKGILAFNKSAFLLKHQTQKVQPLFEEVELINT